MKHIKIFENNNKEYHIISYYSDFSINNFVYDNEEYAFNHLLKHMYSQYGEYNVNFDALDNCYNIDELMVEYNNFVIDENITTDEEIYYDKAILNDGDNGLPKDIKMRRDAKKYNL